MLCFLILDLVCALYLRLLRPSLSVGATRLAGAPHVASTLSRVERQLEGVRKVALVDAAVLEDDLNGGPGESAVLWTII